MGRANHCCEIELTLPVSNTANRHLPIAPQFPHLTACLSALLNEFRGNHNLLRMAENEVRKKHPVRWKSYKSAPCVREWISSSESHFYKKPHMQFVFYMQCCLATQLLAFGHGVFITTHFPLLVLSTLLETFAFPCWICTSAGNQTMLNVAQHVEHRSCVTSSPSKKALYLLLLTECHLSVSPAFSEIVSWGGTVF